MAIIKQKEKGLLVVISGPSGAGKDSIIQEVLKEKKDTWLSVSMTSREPRIGEEEGKDYFFVTREGFENHIKHLHCSKFKFV